MNYDWPDLPVPLVPGTESRPRWKVTPGPHPPGTAAASASGSFGGAQGRLGTRTCSRGLSGGIFNLNFNLSLDVTPPPLKPLRPQTDFPFAGWAWGGLGYRDEKPEAEVKSLLVCAPLSPLL